ncbi:uncharacterized protein LOC141633364 isoform X1 [Silene latifolia]|uniref:uncharacterized protein LOC141633364 isoform X1 n=1 Tax=Silene latifolia TaxID=37657 RepID=UPI003D783216
MFIFFNHRFVTGNSWFTSKYVILNSPRKLGIMAVGYQRAMMFIVVVMTMLVQRSLQLRSSHPMHQIVDKVNHCGGPYIGLVLAFPYEEVPLQASGLFVPNPKFPVVHLSGRTFNIGKIKNVDVIYVMTVEQTASPFYHHLPDHTLNSFS